MGHGQAFTAVYAEGGIYGISPATTPRPDRMHPIGSYMFYVVPVATIVKTIFYLGRRHSEKRNGYNVLREVRTAN
eukprot:6214020-Pleurochrysis_carterae.AAC.2